ncbi:DUF2269 domain-containing protein [Streptomyces agglomeratus]|uniref:DUF2269 domain-containing protein n=1 Tax=Streptomyces agglomeratus TaxID=285458 RepID=A0A1E5P955_9ACTN|nr:DUF2269 domain-containing protein [Streptomyces agglomeratus]OEJ26060.1 DUF2269 domain-containing protein [Streptomyces agglomeratus]OEJ39884.1 DUF2269 domain-containing protein [Streptomyces agglomeratus]OEJ45737.1 DUF2269 domain-containing protein [Streptomyces agglomeratus]OEJ52433.1 DUF2269 domain-containing protein [Streptomyces agglomeratus]OEJ59804.1 DUF2269 domain-containing protein [Streptomyces agglomeratus]
MKPLPRPARRALLVTHLAASVGWLGLTVGLTALGITAWTTDSPAMTRSAYTAMKVFGDWLVTPVALLSLGTGLALSLGTPWGLARYRWVWVKFWLTLVTGAATVFALRPGISAAAALGVPDSSLVAAPVVASSAYLFMTAISVLKPWGLTRRGRRSRAVSSSSRKTVDGRSVRQPA